MAKGDINIPDEVKRDIEQRLTSLVDEAITEFESAEEEEDAFTGHLLGKLTTRARRVLVENAQSTSNWTWSLQYRKFRSRGFGATEKILGADGIVELAVTSSGASSTKAMLFQAKMASARDATQLVTQCAHLSTWREAAAVFSYSAKEIKALTLDDVLRAKGRLSVGYGRPLGTFLSQNFIGCEIGDTALKYDSPKRQLIWLNTKGQKVSVRFNVKHRVKIDVTDSVAETDRPVEIPAAGIIDNRMQFTPTSLLGTDEAATSKDIKKRQKQLTIIYHPDAWMHLDPSGRKIMETRTKEFQSIDIRTTTSRRESDW